MQQLSPAKIANRYFDLILRLVDTDNPPGPAEKIWLKKRIKNLYRFVDTALSDGVIKASEKKTKREVFKDSTGSMSVYEV